MRIIIAGGHGQIALRLARLLGSAAVGLVRNPAHVPDVEATGARAVVCAYNLARVSPQRRRGRRVSAEALNQFNPLRLLCALCVSVVSRGSANLD